MYIQVLILFFREDENQNAGSIHFFGGIVLTFLAGISVVFATTNSYNCTLSAGATCGKSYTAYSFSSNVNSNSASQYICAGYVLSGTVYCTQNIITGSGSGVQ